MRTRELDALSVLRGVERNGPLHCAHSEAEPYRRVGVYGVRRQRCEKQDAQDTLIAVLRSHGAWR